LVCAVWGEVMKKRTIVSLIIAAIWALLIWVGYGLIGGVAEQHVPQHPSAGQIEFLIGLPIFGCLLSMASALAGQKLKSPAFILLPLLSIFGLIIYVLLSGGGM
jgi:hypothetical protein